MPLSNFELAIVYKVISSTGYRRVERSLVLHCCRSGRHFSRFTLLVYLHSRSAVSCSESLVMGLAVSPGCPASQCPGSTTGWSLLAERRAYIHDDLKLTHYIIEVLAALFDLSLYQCINRHTIHMECQ